METVLLKQMRNCLNYFVVVPQVEAMLEGPSGQGNTSVTDNGDGTFTIRYAQRTLYGLTNAKDSSPLNLVNTNYMLLCGAN
jgi:hypothetical protein